jgi:hypothetical protein
MSLRVYLSLDTDSAKCLDPDSVNQDPKNE